MSSSTRDEGEHADRRIIREAKQEAWHARRLLSRELPRPPTETKVEVVAALADYYDVLSDYRGERALEEPFDERLPVDPWTLLEDTMTIEESVSRSNPHAKRTKEVPVAAGVEARRLIELGKELDKIALELGFAAPAKEATPEDEATMKDLRGLLKARDQTEALEYLPDGEATDMPDITEGSE